MVKRSSVQHAEATVLEADYVSALFGQFCGHIAAMGRKMAILDLGPSTPRNVMYWIGRGHPVSALDSVAHGPDELGKLDYPDGSFSGVLCWTALSHLAPAQARQLMQEIGRVLQTGGWLFAVFDGDGRRPPTAQRYRILDSERLAFESLEDRTQPRAVLTREVEALFQPFREVRIMVMRHGSREALGRRP